MMVPQQTRLPARRSRSSAMVALVALLALAACTEDTPSPRADQPADAAADSDQQQNQTQPQPVRFTDNVQARNVSVDSRVTVTAENGTIDDVALSYGRGAGRTVSGTLDKAATTWTADELLEPGEAYRLRMSGASSDGRNDTELVRFRTENLTLDEQTYPSLAPLDGATVGVGMPVILTFDIPVTDRAAVQRQLEVTSTPRVRGTWHWYSDTEVHFRPRSYWPAGTEVNVEVKLNGVNVGGGIYGQESRDIDFTVGKSVISKIDLDAHTMRVFIDGELARTIPVTGGKPGFDTRSGVKVIMEKFESKRMDAATTGIDPGNPEYYNLSNVQYAMRETYSGEFIHAAPWSVGSQGSANVSHGCIGMSTENAAWLFAQSSVGDVVKVTGSSRQLEEGNGWTDWNVSWSEYRQGSAL
jgi:lipoprotein-anchoring transpeptidase ErfK/SrfK